VQIIVDLLMLVILLLDIMLLLNLIETLLLLLTDHEWQKTSIITI
jgi:hypothetical protein